MRFYKPIYSFIITMLLIVVYAAPGEEAEELDRFLSTIEEKHTTGEAANWNDTFQKAFTELCENSTINPKVFTLLSKALRGGGGPDISPEKFAQTVYDAAKDADRGLRRGENPIKVREQMRSRFELAERFNADAFSDTASKVKDQVRNNLENRGRGNTSSFIPPGLDIRNKLRPPYEGQLDDIPFDRDDTDQGDHPGGDNDEGGQYRP